MHCTGIVGILCASCDWAPAAAAAVCVCAMPASPRWPLWLWQAFSGCTSRASRANPAQAASGLLLLLLLLLAVCVCDVGLPPASSECMAHTHTVSVVRPKFVGRMWKATVVAYDTNFMSCLSIAVQQNEDVGCVEQRLVAQ